jgi:hypothetical protein
MTPDITLADAITALVAEKRAVGYKHAAEERALARFAEFRRSEFPGPGAPTQASVEAWLAAARRRGAASATLQTHMGHSSPANDNRRVQPRPRYSRGSLISDDTRDDHRLPAAAI